MLNTLKEEAGENTEHIFTLSGTHSREETRPVIDEVLKEHAGFAYIRFTGFEKECRTYEARYGMGSEEFLRRFESGDMGDDLHWFDWYAALRGKKLWERKHSVLRGISWKT